jgi:hypothetical protein
LRVDLRALAALGGALIIVGSFLPWVAPQFQPVVRVFGPATAGGWPILLFGVLAIVLQFWPQFRAPRVSLPAAALGFAAGTMALASALNTIGLGRTLIGEQTISPLTGVGIGVYLTMAGSLMPFGGLAPLSLTSRRAPSCGCGRHPRPSSERSSCCADWAQSCLDRGSVVAAASAAARPHPQCSMRAFWQRR